MQRLQAFKFELMPDGAQQRDMRRFSGACRFVYNKALALQKANYEAGGKFIGYVTLAKSLTDWRNGPDTPWLKDAPCHPLQHALKDLERAYKNFFAKRADFPRFKRKGSGESFRYPDAKQFEIDQDNSRIKLPKLGWMRYRNSQGVVGLAKNITVSCVAGKWYASIQTEREVPQPVPAATKAIGIDGHCPFCHIERRQFHCPTQQFQETPTAPGPLPAAHEPQSQIQQQLEKGKSQGSKGSQPHSQRPKRLLAQDHHSDQPKPRARLY